MFDTVTGLPVHILVVHATVVMGPLAALGAVVYAAAPRWRRVLRWPVAALAVVAGTAAAVAARSGEALEARLLELGLAGEALESVQRHTDAGTTARNVALVFLAVALVATLWLAAPGARGLVPLLVSVVLALSAGGVVVTTVLAGHSGSTAVWGDLVENTSAP